MRTMLRHWWVLLLRQCVAVGAVALAAACEGIERDKAMVPSGPAVLAAPRAEVRDETPWPALPPSRDGSHTGRVALTLVGQLHEGSGGTGTGQTRYHFHFRERTG